MLFVDREPIQLADLETVEPGIHAVCTTEKIPLDGGPDTFLRHIAGECANRIATAMTAMTSYPSNGDLNGNHLAIVFSAYGTRNVPRIHLAQLCLNPRIRGTWSPLKSWLVYCALERIYVTAWNRRTSAKGGPDKYETKAVVYAGKAANAWAELTASGLPIVWQPLPAPGAWHEDSGTWGTASLSSTSGASELGGTFRVQVTWTSAEYTSAAVRANAESHPSPEAVLEIPAGNRLSIDISSLTPPSGFDFQAQGYSQGVYFPRAATGWNVYVNGVLQNAVPIPVATKSHSLAGDPNALGVKVSTGQYPDIYSVMPTGVPVFRA
jgi:hypothetical protein